MIKVIAFLSIFAVLWTGGCHTLYNILRSQEGVVPSKLSNIIYFAGPIGGLIFIVIAVILIVIALSSG